jgi:hypothetical protein
MYDPLERIVEDEDVFDTIEISVFTDSMPALLRNKLKNLVLVSSWLMKNRRGEIHPAEKKSCMTH